LANYPGVSGKINSHGFLICSGFQFKIFFIIARVTVITLSPVYLTAAITVYFLPVYGRLL